MGATLTPSMRRSVLVLVLAALSPSAQGTDAPLLVFAAASLKNALDAVVSAYEAGHEGDAKVSYAASSTLARQIERGAPAQIYVSANQAWMNRLADAGLINTRSRVDLLRNAVVLVAPKASDTRVHIGPGFDIVGALDGAPLAMANARAVPAGIYGRQALAHFGVWKRLRGRVAQTSNVRTALALVARGEAPLGVVYASDALAEEDVRVVDTFSSDSHAPVIYPAAITEAGTHPQAERFMRFLRSDTAGAIFRDWGFELARVEH